MYNSLFSQYSRLLMLFYSFTVYSILLCIYILYLLHLFILRFRIIRPFWKETPFTKVHYLAAESEDKDYSLCLPYFSSQRTYPSSSLRSSQELFIVVNHIYKGLHMYILLVLSYSVIICYWYHVPIKVSSVVMV